MNHTSSHAQGLSKPKIAKVSSATTPAIHARTQTKAHSQMRPPAKLLVSHLSGRNAITRQRNARTVNKAQRTAILMLIAKPVATRQWPSAIRRQENVPNAKPQIRTAIRLKELVTQLATLFLVACRVSTFYC